MRLPRMTVRRWVAFIGLAAAFMAATVYHRRREAWRAYCVDRHRYHALYEAEYRTHSVNLGRDATEFAKTLEDQGLPEAKRKRLRYLLRTRLRGTKGNAELSEFHGRMKLKWERGTSSLWLWVDPDPPTEG